ncbi:MAG: DUF928 domain-containing protein [Coleofasciculus sp. S288]|nr:DUF928 domain-containing protein [Coleofasciculus sp. S288]
MALSVELLLLISLSAWGQTASVLAQGIPERWEYKKFQPPSDVGVPSRREGAASRGNCWTGSTPLTALVPTNSFGVTTEDYPTLFFYLPAPQFEASPPVAEFVLMDEKEQHIYAATFNTTGKPGIISISIPSLAGLPPLEVGKDYQWIFSLNCSSQISNEVVFVSGQLRRVPINTILFSKLRQASSLQERADLYAEAEIWHNALMTLAELRRSNPNDPSMVADWEKLLKSVTLDAIANEPFIEVP